MNDEKLRDAIEWARGFELCREGNEHLRILADAAERSLAVPTEQVQRAHNDDVCHHGHLARQCEICEAVRERDEALEYVEQMRMDVRDEFAAAALTGITASGRDGETKTLANRVYEIADAMMARRKR